MVWSYFNEHVNIPRYLFPQKEDVETEPEWCKTNRLIRIENKDKATIGMKLFQRACLHTSLSITTNGPGYFKATRRIGTESKDKTCDGLNLFQRACQHTSLSIPTE